MPLHVLFGLLLLVLGGAGAQCQPSDSEPAPFQHEAHVAESTLQEALDEAGCTYLYRLGTHFARVGGERHLAITGIDCEGPSHSRTVLVRLSDDAEEPHVRSFSHCEDQTPAYYHRLNGDRVAVMAGRMCRRTDSGYVETDNAYAPDKLRERCGETDVLRRSTLWGGAMPVVKSIRDTTYAVTRDHRLVRCTENTARALRALSPDLIEKDSKNEAIIDVGTNYAFFFNGSEEVVTKVPLQEGEPETIPIQNVVDAHSLGRVQGRLDDPGMTHTTDAGTFYLLLFTQESSEWEDGLHVIRYAGER